MLIVNDVVKDYDAVMTSVDHLKTIWPSSDWPEGLTFEGSHRPWLALEGVSDTTIVRVHRRHPIRVMVTGCVYINPTQKRGYDAVVYLWARQSELAGGLENRLYAAVKDWVAKEWPFKKVAFPGRDISWEVWRAIPDDKR